VIRRVRAWLGMVVGVDDVDVCGVFEVGGPGEFRAVWYPISI
jgi:hypothetical protein